MMIIKIARHFLQERTSLQVKRHRKDAEKTNQESVYETSSSGFRYRMLATDAWDGYNAAINQLRPGEYLYRMMDGKDRVNGKLFPVRIADRLEWESCFVHVEQQEWQFKLAAGVPLNSSFLIPTH